MSRWWDLADRKGARWWGKKLRDGWSIYASPNGEVFEASTARAADLFCRAECPSADQETPECLAKAWAKRHRIEQLKRGIA